MTRVLELLRSKLPAGVAAGPASAASAKPERKFFEVFGDALTENLFLRNLAIVLAGSCIALTVALVRLAQKPPLVIRVDRLSEPAAFTDVVHESHVTGPEVRNFVEHFTRYLLAWDLYTLDDDIDRALGMMTPEAAGKMKNRLDGMSVTPKVKADALRTKVVISEISVEKDSPRAVTVKVRGARTSESYEKADLRRETVFEDTLILRKTARSLETPWGLLVEDWSESIYKEIP